MIMNAQSVGTVLLVIGAVIISVFGVNPDKNSEATANAIKPAKQTVLTQEEVKRIGHTSKLVAASSLPRARTARLPIFYTKDPKASPFAAASPSSAPKVVGQAGPTTAAEDTKQTAAAVLIEEKAIEEKVGDALGVQLPILPVVATFSWSSAGPLPSSVHRVGRTPGHAMPHGQLSAAQLPNGPAKLDRSAIGAVKMDEMDDAVFGDILTNQVGGVEIPSKAADKGQGRSDMIGLAADASTEGPPEEWNWTQESTRLDGPIVDDLMTSRLLTLFGGYLCTQVLLVELFFDVASPLCKAWKKIEGGENTQSAASQAGKEIAHFCLRDAKQCAADFESVKRWIAVMEQDD